MFPLLVQPWFTTGYHGCGCRWWVFHRLGDWRLVVFRYEEPIAHLWGFFVPMKTGILPWGTSGPWGSIRGPGKQHYTSTCRSLFGSQTGWQDGLVNKNIFISYKMGIFHQCTSEWWFQSYLFIFTKWITMTRFAKWSTDRRRIRNQSQVVCAKATKARPFFAESWLRILDQNGPTKTWHEDGLCFVLFVYCIHIYILHNDYPSWGKCLPPRPRGAVEKSVLNVAACCLQELVRETWPGIVPMVWMIPMVWHRPPSMKHPRHNGKTMAQGHTSEVCSWYNSTWHGLVISATALTTDSQLLAPLKANTIWVSGVMQTGPWDAFCRFCVEHKSTVAGWETFDGTAKDTISLQFKGLASCLASFFFPKLWCYVSGGAAISLHPWLLRQMKPSPGNPL